MPAIRSNSKKPHTSPSDNSGSSGSVSSAIKPKQPSEPCPICNTVMSRAADLGRHMRTHQQQKEFVCMYDVGNCSYASHSKTDLDIHMRRAHLKVKPFACEDCSYASADAAGLYRHRRRHHGYVPRTVRTVRASPKKKDLEEPVSDIPIPASVQVRIRAVTVQENDDEGSSYSQQFRVHRFNAGASAGKRNEDDIDELDSSSYDSDIAPWVPVPSRGHYTPHPPPPPPTSDNHPLVMHMTHQESHFPHIPQPYYESDFKFAPKKSALSSESMHWHYPFLPQSSKVEIPTFSNTYPADHEQSVPSIQGWNSVSVPSQNDRPYAQYPLALEVPASNVNDLYCKFNTCSTTQGIQGPYPTNLQLNTVDTLDFHSIANDTHLDSESLLVDGFHQLTVTESDSYVGSHSWEFDVNKFDSDFSSSSSSPGVTIPGSGYDHESADNDGNAALNLNFGQDQLELSSYTGNDLVLPMTFEELAAVYASIYDV